MVILLNVFQETHTQKQSDQFSATKWPKTESQYQI